MSLADKKCAPCAGDVPPLTAAEIAPLLGQLPGWDVVDEHHLHREFVFGDFAEGLNFVNLVGELAEEEGHHPSLHLSWGHVVVDVWTHKIDALTESDFILAAKIARQYHPEPGKQQRIWRAEDPAHAHLLAGLLESQEIPATVQGESRFAGIGSFVPADALPTIWVPDAEAARARAILQAHHDAQAEDSE